MPLEWTGLHRFSFVPLCTLPATQGQRSKDPIQLGLSSLRWLIIATSNREQMLRATLCTSAAGAKRRWQTLLSSKGATHVENRLVRDNTTFLRRARPYKQLACQQLTTGISGPIVA